MELRKTLTRLKRAMTCLVPRVASNTDTETDEKSRVGISPSAERPTQHHQVSHPLPKFQFTESTMSSVQRNILAGVCHS